MIATPKNPLHDDKPPQRECGLVALTTAGDVCELVCLLLSGRSGDHGVPRLERFWSEART